MRLYQRIKFYIAPGIVTISSALLLYWGWYTSEIADSHDGLPLARAGSLITALSLVFVFWRYGRRLADTETMIMRVVNDRLRKEPISEQDAAVVSVRLADRIHLKADRIEKIITRWQACLLALGTVDWGFGDLLFTSSHLPGKDLLLRVLSFGAH